MGAYVIFLFPFKFFKSKRLQNGSCISEIKAGDVTFSRLAGVYRV